MKIELDMSKSTICRILTQYLGYQKCSHRLFCKSCSEHSKDIIKEVKKNKGFFYNIVTGEEICFQYDSSECQMRASEREKHQKNSMKKVSGEVFGIPIIHKKSIYMMKLMALVFRSV